MEKSNITKIEISKHLWLPMFTAEIYLNNSNTASARIDQDGADYQKISKFMSTMETRTAGLDTLLNSVTLKKLEEAKAAI